jgi:polyphosphate kinase
MHMQTRQPSSNAVVPTESVDLSTEAGETKYFNRDLSWLNFNRRVLHEAADERTPLLERVRFLGIFTSNLDEFFMKRVAHVRRQAAAGPSAARTPDGKTATEVLKAVRESVMGMFQQQADIYVKQLGPLLRQQNIFLLEWEELTQEERLAVSNYFMNSVFPVLTPLAVDQGSPFPFISGLSSSLGVLVHHPGKHDTVFARVKIPEVLPKWISVSAQPGVYRMVSLRTLIRANLQALFPDMTIVDAMLFRVTRGAEVDLQPDEGEDLREVIEDELKQRRFAPVVRLEHGPKPSEFIVNLLMSELTITEADVYELQAELDYDDLKQVAELNLPTLRFTPWTPLLPASLAADDNDIFAAIRRGDILVHHPYESFGASVERFVTEAAADPNVLAIKMTLYRTGDASPFVRTLVRAAERYKQVVCLIEIKARFDEERNILLADAMEKAGAHVVYGLMGLKTHCKAALVVRQDPDGIRCYVHLGTGNYHAQTARLYTDLGLLTCDPQITRDVVELFHYLTGRSGQREYRKLLVAPVNMRDRFLDMISREVQHHLAGRPAQILAKMNALEERKIIGALYSASGQGLPIDLVVRGFCTLRPGVPGLSENIRVSSVIGRFLEHSRIYYFRNGAADPLDGEFYIGSADWMYRNLLARVETIVPIEKRALKEKCWIILQTLLNDHRQAWDLQSDGTYVQRTPPEGSNDACVIDLGTHETLMALARKEAAAYVEAMQGPQ